MIVTIVIHEELESSYFIRPNVLLKETLIVSHRPAVTETFILTQFCFS